MADLFRDVKVRVNDSETTVKMQIGCSFENNSKIYRVNNDGKLSVFDKQTQTWSAGNEIVMKKYQFDVFKAVADNTREKINGKSTDAIVLSKDDITYATETLFSNKKLTADLGEYLSNPYTATKVNSYGKDSAISAYITSGDATSSAILVFKHGSANDAEKISDIATKQAVDLKKENKFSAKVPAKAAQNISSAAEQATKSFSWSWNDPFADIFKMNKTNEVNKSQATSKNAAVSKTKKTETKAKTQKSSTTFDYMPEGYKAYLELTAKKMNVEPEELEKYITEISKKSGRSKYFISHLVAVENYEPVVRDTKDGTITGGFGHTKLRDKSLKLGEKVDPKKAIQWLVDDVKYFEQQVKNIPVDQNSNDTIGDYWKTMPVSMREALVDIAFIRNVNKLKSDEYKSFRANLKKGKENLPACSVQLRQDFSKYSFKQKLNHTHTTGLMKRNCYRFLLAIKDMSPEQKAAAKRRFENSNGYYSETLRLLKAKGYDAEAELLEAAWKNM